MEKRWVKNVTERNDDDVASTNNCFWLNNSFKSTLYWDNLKCKKSEALIWLPVLNQKKSFMFSYVKQMYYVPINN